MQDIVKHAHSGLRWVLLLFLVIAIINAYNGWSKRQPYEAKDKRWHLLAFIFCHIQLLLGLILYGLNWGGKVDFGNMKNAAIRFYTVEHLTLMLLAIVIISIGYIRSKKVVETPRRFRMIFSSYLIGLILILAGIPWPFRNLGAGWF